MAKSPTSTDDSPEVSTIATKMLEDANGLVSRLDTYLSNIKMSKPNFQDDQLLFNSAGLSVLEGLGAKIIRENLPDTEVYALVDAVNAHTAQAIKLNSDPKEKEKLQLQAARTEAALKGFVLPLSLGGPSNELKPEGLQGDAEYLIAMEATKQAIRETGGKNIPKEKYAEAIVAKTAEILKADSRNFPPEKLAQFNKFIQQGTQVKKAPKINDHELGLVNKAASKAVAHFVKAFNTNTEHCKQASTTIDKILDQNTQNLKAQRYKIDNNTQAAINSQLKEQLCKLDPEYLKAHSSEIATEISQGLKANRSWKSVFFSDYSIPEASLKKVVSDLSTKHSLLNKKEALTRPTPRDPVTTQIVSTKVEPAPLKSQAPSKARPTTAKPEITSPKSQLATKPRSASAITSQDVHKPKEPSISRTESERGKSIQKADKGKISSATKPSKPSMVEKLMTKKASTNKQASKISR